MIKCRQAKLFLQHQSCKEFQDFYFYWVEDISVFIPGPYNISLSSGRLSKPHKLAIWNAERIKRKKLTENELYRIYQIFDRFLTGRGNLQFTDLNGNRFAPSRWKDSDNPNEED